MLKMFRSKRKTPQNELSELLGEGKLPVFPAIVMRAMEKIRDDKAPLSSVADIVATDPGFSVRVLRTVNSAAFSLRHEVRNVHHAVSLLGRGPLESMLISMAVRDTLPRRPVTGYDATRFWTTSARRAVTAKRLADRIDPSSRSESFTAALLQDMAIPILSHRKGPEYGPLLEHWHHGDDDLAALERDAFGWDHAAVGNWMCSEWKFPTQLANAIGAHHGTGDEEWTELPAVSLVASLREVDESIGVEQLIEAASGTFNLQKDDLADLVVTSFEDAESVAHLFV